MTLGAVSSWARHFSSRRETFEGDSVVSALAQLVRCGSPPQVSQSREVCCPATEKRKMRRTGTIQNLDWATALLPNSGKAPRRQWHALFRGDCNRRAPPPPAIPPPGRLPDLQLSGCLLCRALLICNQEVVYGD